MKLSLITSIFEIYLILALFFDKIQKSFYFWIHNCLFHGKTY
jgi:hypothetical protein